MIVCVLQPFLETRFVDKLSEVLYIRGALDPASFAARFVSHLLIEQVEQEVVVLGEALVVEF